MKFEIENNVIASYKRLSYDAWFAFAEFVDNSTQSYFDNKIKLDKSFAKNNEKLKVTINYNANDDSISIIDNSIGMNEVDLDRALKVGKHWSVAHIKRVGGDGIKLLLYYHPDAPTAAIKRSHVEKIVAECAQWDIPFFLEPIAYSLDPQHNLSNAELLDVSIHMAGLFSGIGVDILKMSFPVDAKQSDDDVLWQDACERLHVACDGTPWALLSGGVSYATFARQARIACTAGAQGVIVGRAVWADAIPLSGDEREDFLEGIAAARMQELAAITALIQNA